MRKILLVLAFVVLYVLHQDIWNWTRARPFVFGFMPVGLFYQGCYSIAAALFMWMLVKFAWPAHLEQEVEGGQAFEEGAAAREEVRS